jgi:hypothetical protein
VGIGVLLVLFISARWALAPLWRSDIANQDYVAYADGAQLVLCAEGTIGGREINPLQRLSMRFATDTHLDECVYVEFVSPLAPGSYSLDGRGHAVTSGTGATQLFEAAAPSLIKSLWFERTCFCRVTDVEATFSGALIIDSVTPLAGRLKLDIAEPKNTVSIDAPLAGFTEGSVSELRRRENFRRRISK